LVVILRGLSVSLFSLLSTNVPLRNMRSFVSSIATRQVLRIIHISSRLCPESRAAFVSPRAPKNAFTSERAILLPPSLPPSLPLSLSLIFRCSLLRRVDSPLYTGAAPRDRVRSWMCPAHVRGPGCIRRVSAAVDSLRRRYSLFRPSRPRERET